jgi:signal transduction histidine kinase
MASSIEQDLSAIARIGAVPVILRTVRELTELRFTLVARVLPDRWVACAVHDEIAFGLRAGGELDVNTTFCSVVRENNEPVVMDHASQDPKYKDHPTPKMYGFESYVAVPLYRKNGEYFGTLCGLDPLPRPVNNEKTLSTFKLFAELISTQLEAEEQHTQDRAELVTQREAAQLREQFIAVLGHDVRNPLGSIIMGTELLLRRATDSGDRRTLERVRASARRIGALVDDVLDLARGQLGGGLELVQAEVGDLVTRLQHVIDEVQASHPTRPISVEVSAMHPVRCDEKRVEQLLSNLLANAVQHGASHTPIQVRLGGDETTFSLSVANRGETIPARIRANLFQPYFRGGLTGRGDGLGLGLYIVSEIARAHAGTIAVTSDEGTTVFTFTMPR